MRTGYFSVSIIHRTLAWTAGSFTCVCDLFTCVYTRDLGLLSYPKDLFIHFIVQTLFITYIDLISHCGLGSADITDEFRIQAKPEIVWIIYSYAHGFSFGQHSQHSFGNMASFWTLSERDLSDFARWLELYWAPPFTSVFVTMTDVWGGRTQKGETSSFLSARTGEITLKPCVNFVWKEIRHDRNWTKTFVVNKSSQIGGGNRYFILLEAKH